MRLHGRCGLPGDAMSTSLRTLLVLALLGAGGAVLAQGSPLYRIEQSSMVSASGAASSPAYQATVTGGEGAPAQSASSPSHAVVVGSGGQDPVNANAIFDSGFE